MPVRVWLPLILSLVSLLGWPVAPVHAAPLAPPPSATATSATDVPEGIHFQFESAADQSRSSGEKSEPLTFVIDAGSIDNASDKFALLKDGFAMQVKMALVKGAVMTTYVNGTQAAMNKQGLSNPHATGASPTPLRIPGHKGQLVVMRVDHAILSTCEEPLGHRHYEVRAQTLYLFENGEYRAEELSFFFVGRRIFTLSHYDGHLATADGGMVPTYLPKVITFGTSPLDGTYLGVHYRFPLGRGNILDFAGRLGTEQLIRGTLSFSHHFTLAPHGMNGEVALVVGYHEDVENRLTGSDAKTNVAYSDLTVNRLPAVQVTLAPLRFGGSLKNYSLRVGGGVGEYSEQPTNVTAFRSQLWGILSTPHYRLGPVELSGQFGIRGAFYGSSTLGNYATKLTLETPASSTVYGNISYFHRGESGTTPFLFDRVLLPDEIYAEVSFPIAKSPFRLDVQNREDTTSWTSRDFWMGATYSTDCLSYGLYYDTVTKGFGFQVQMTAKGPLHKGVPGIGFTQ